MALWLMPFGFIAGLTFSLMTGLNTFENLGIRIGSWSEPLIAGLLGMASGWIGSYTAAFSVNSEKNDELRSLRRLGEEGKWLLLLETPFGVELPWQFIQEINPSQIVRFNDL